MSLVSAVPCKGGHVPAGPGVLGWQRATHAPSAGCSTGIHAVMPGQGAVPGGEGQGTSSGEPAGVWGHKHSFEGYVCRSGSGWEGAAVPMGVRWVLAVPSSLSWGAPSCSPLFPGWWKHKPGVLCRAPWQHCRQQELAGWLVSTGQSGPRQFGIRSRTQP